MHNDDDDKSCKTKNELKNGSLVKIVELEAESFNFFFDKIFFRCIY